MPTQLTVEPFYIERLFLLIGRRCQEHGFSQALDSMEKHLFHLREARNMPSTPTIYLEGYYCYMEFKFLAAGLLVATATFVVELAIAFSWSSCLLAWTGPMLSLCRARLICFTKE